MSSVPPPLPKDRPVGGARPSPPRIAPIPQKPRLGLVCIGGPDEGRSIRLDTKPTSLGRRCETGFLSDDPDVLDEHLRAEALSDQVRLACVGEALIFVGDQPVDQASLRPGEKVRIGSSLWEAHSGGNKATAWLTDMGDRVTSAAGVEQLQGFSLRAMFAETFKLRNDREIESHFSYGFESTTPALAEIDTSWPRPWAFMWMLLLCGVAFAAIHYAWKSTEALTLLPGLMVIGSAITPLALLTLFYELNAPRNVSWYQILKLFLTGGCISLLFSLLLFAVLPFDEWWGSVGAGPIEEIGKGAVLLLVVRNRRYPWMLNGMLCGAAVGAGFAAFESAGYAFMAAAGVLPGQGGFGSEASMFYVMMARSALIACGSHILWTALVGAGLWQVKKDGEFAMASLTDIRFVRLLASAIILHMAWNFPLELPFFARQIALGLVGWLLLLGVVQAGLREIRLAQRDPDREGVREGASSNG